MVESKWSYRERVSHGFGKTPFVPANTHGQNEGPCAPAFQQAFVTSTSTLRCDDPGLMARIPAFTAATVAFAAARIDFISVALWTAIRSESARPALTSSNAGKRRLMVFSHKGSTLASFPRKAFGSSSGESRSRK